MFFLKLTPEVILPPHLNKQPQEPKTLPYFIINFITLWPGFAFVGLLYLKFPYIHKQPFKAKAEIDSIILSMPLLSAIKDSQYVLNIWQ